METESEQNSNSASGSSGSGGSTRPQISQMTLYERQAVQALQALQRQPNAAQYFHQFMFVFLEVPISGCLHLGASRRYGPRMQKGGKRSKRSKSPHPVPGRPDRTPPGNSPGLPAMLGEALLERNEGTVLEAGAPPARCRRAPTATERERRLRTGFTWLHLALPAPAVPPPPARASPGGRPLRLLDSAGGSQEAGPLIGPWSVSSPAAARSPLATIAASRQASSPNTSTPQQATTTQASMNLATTSAAQLISRSQSVSSPSATTLTQSVLLGNTTSPPLNQSQAQMYLRPQLGNLLQVNRTLGRNVPLTSQLILMPNGAVAAVQQKVPSAHSPGVHADTDQVQNLAVRSQQTSAANVQLQASAPKAALPGISQASVQPQVTHASQTLTVTQTSSGNVGQSLNLSQGAAGSNGLSGGVVSSVGNQVPTSLSQATSSGPVGGCQRKGTGVVQPLPAASAAQAVTVSQGSQTEAENAAAKKAEADGAGPQTVGMNLTRTATPAPSQTLISSATYTQIQPHSLIQQQQQIHLQKQVVIQQQIAIHHQQQFQHRQSQLLHTATHPQLAQPQQHAPPQAPPLQGQQAPPLQGQQAAQTLVVQPMLQSPHVQLQQQESPCQAATKSPIPIQSKPPVAPLKVPQLGAAKMSASQQPPPHIPVQVVGSRQQGLAQAQAQALGLPQMNVGGQPSRGMPAVVQPVSQAHTASLLSQGSSPPPPQEAPPPPLTPGVNVAQVQGTAQVVKSMTSSPGMAQAPAAAYYVQPVQLPSKPQTLAVKRKAESEEERDEPGALPSLLPTKSSPVAESPKGTDEKSGLGGEGNREKSESAPSAASNTPPSDPCSVAPSSASSASTLGLVSRQLGDSKPPQAIVKPQILTHIIEGFVIQEGAEPFPVGCSQLLKDFEKPLQGGASSRQTESQPSNSPGGDSVTAEQDKKGNLLKCEFCGKYGPANQFRGSKRFCSVTCAKRYNVGCSHQLRLQRKKMKEIQEASYARRRRGPRRSSSEIARAKIQGKRHRGQEDSSRGSDNSSYDEALSPTSPGPLSVRAAHGERDLTGSSLIPPTTDLHGINPVFLSSNPSRWSVEEVYEFIASLQGCQEIAEEFRSQEIDGQALLLLKEEHLMSAMNIKLGPALKICAKINVLKET
ncbi:PREDICTED: polyhomeotic-like protein 1 [Gekko japonicus]|uniref:Polyhomeotic-like protein 1 n=1 Tax=Gekko japonicus TaxID=146911 RepID=A0ABM1JUZ7_GEKJA|nr:PREDICTED: polyhomeotic-like protein 1 [Gekko japonicus]